ncbi:nuclear transport factor 2 family protein [Acidocella sp.]|uniref:nuclear transport factor 2 family protein n=1 Tax=Acidocella sp. TaxID=50710 RepID=UPI002635ADF7|nr:nuclear transport factor 2 family protein [Acidocella sp.]
MTDTLQDLAARQAITDHIHRYCRSVDRLDIPLGHSIWHDDGIAEYPGYYQGPGKGVIDLICQNHQGLLHHTHQVTNILIQLQGRSAGSETYCIATLRMQKGDKTLQMMVWSRYVDHWSCRDGHWGLDKRIAIREFDEIREVTPMMQHDLARRDRSDPSYGVLPVQPEGNEK